MKQKLKIFFLSAEAAPFAKVGGLGDVAGALPKALADFNIDIRICLPLYGFIDRKKYKIKKISQKILVSAGGRNEKINLWFSCLPGRKTPVYLIEHRFFNSKKIYQGAKILKNNKYTRGVDDIKRFSFFTRAAIEMAKRLKFKPDIIHCHDWHTALAPDFIKIENKKNDYFKSTKTVFTIHNLANQGIAGPEIVGYSKLDSNSPIIKADLKNGDINFMVQGIFSSDIVNTVSPTYAKEILTHYRGAGLDKILQKKRKDIYGILNGIDIDFYNPETDKFIKQKYAIKNLGEKTANKLDLQKKLGLPINKKIALVGLVSRFVWQKGIELITEEFKKLNCQFVFLGTGEKKYEDYLKGLAKKYPNQFSAQIKFDEILAHQIYAGSDIFLMPSLFEPCGLGQMIAMRYGTVPIARETGGLKDTVKNFKSSRLSNGQISSLKNALQANGFTFKDFSEKTFYKILDQALAVYYYEPKIWRQLMINGIKGDYSWGKSAAEYLKLYKLALRK
jgi:starch synthase